MWKGSRYIIHCCCLLTVAALFAVCNCRLCRWHLIRRTQRIRLRHLIGWLEQFDSLDWSELSLFVEFRKSADNIHVDSFSVWHIWNTKNHKSGIILLHVSSANMYDRCCFLFVIFYCYLICFIWHDVLSKNICKYTLAHSTGYVSFSILGIHTTRNWRPHSYICLSCRALTTAMLSWWVHRKQLPTNCSECWTLRPMWSAVPTSSTEDCHNFSVLSYIGWMFLSESYTS